MLKATTLKANGDLGKIVQYEDRRFRERLHSMKTDDMEKDCTIWRQTIWERLYSMQIGDLEKDCTVCRQTI